MTSGNRHKHKDWDSWHINEDGVICMSGPLGNVPKGLLPAMSQRATFAVIDSTLPSGAFCLILPEHWVHALDSLHGDEVLRRHLADGSAIDGQYLAGIDLQLWRLRNMEFRSVSFRDAQLQSAVFADCTFINCHFDNAELSSTQFLNCGFSNSYFVRPRFSFVITDWEAHENGRNNEQARLKLSNCRLHNCHFSLEDRSQLLVSKDTELINCQFS